MKLKNEQLKKPGKIDAQVNEITEESLINAFGVTQNHKLEAANILGAEGNTENWRIFQPDYQFIKDLQTIGKVWIKTIKKFSSFKWVVQKVQHLKLMPVA